MEARLLMDEPRRGSLNMALDEALVESVTRTGVPCWRFYFWEAPTVSLGYFQSQRDRLGHQMSAGCDWVRRSTGGGAIVHDRELTYSFVVPLGRAPFADHRRLVDDVHGALIEQLAEAGIAAQQHGTSRSDLDEPFLCFQRRTAADVVCGGSKVAGSAQRKQRTVLLQHGSVLLRASSVAPELLGVGDVAGVDLDVTWLSRGWTRRLGERWQLTWMQSVFEKVEIAAASGLELNKFANPVWNEKR
ncbi:MAG: biotin/lipoate A/B protein ligase family protein [Planctomycetota bacterium]